MEKVILITLFAGLLLTGCNDRVIDPASDGFAYFPLSVGAVSEYRVDSIIFDDAVFPNKQDTFVSFVRERIIDASLDLEGDSLYVIERSRRANLTDSWVVTDIWSAKRTATNAFRNEENLKFVKLAFPIKSGREWSPLMFISSDVEVPVGTELIEMYTNWEAEVLSVDQSETIGGFTFTDVLTCIQADDNNVVERRYVYEKYVKDVGLVFRMDTILDSRCKRLGQPELCLGEAWNVQGEKGYIMRQEIINFN